MTNREAAMIYNKVLQNPNLTDKEIISELYRRQGKTPAETDQIFEEYTSIIKNVEARGIRGMEIVNFLIAPRDTMVETKEENGITEVNIHEGNPKFDPSGKTDIPGAPVTSVPTFGDENIETIEPIAPTPISEVTPVQAPTTVGQVRTDDFVFGDAPVPNPQENDKPISFPNAESGLNIGEQGPGNQNNGPEPQKFGRF